MEEAAQRRCKVCGREQPLTRFPSAKSTSPGIYYEHKCKDCYARQAREKYQSDPRARALQIARSMNASMLRRTRGRGDQVVEVEALVDLILGASNCAYCDVSLSRFGFAVDHVVPLSNGGLHVMENLVIACQPCNRAKGDLSLDEFREWLQVLRYQV